MARPGCRQAKTKVGARQPQPVFVMLAWTLVLTCVLLHSGTVRAQQPLLDALKLRDFDSVEAIIASGADVNASFADGKTALMVVGKRGMSSLVKQLLDAGADVNAANNNGGTALMFASISGDLPTITLLLDHGADVNAVGANLWSALMVAAVKGHAEIVSLLLEHGADPNLADVYGWTSLMRAASRNRTATARILVQDPRTDIAHRDDDGASALHRAAEEGHMEMVELLIELGADVHALDASGRTAATRAALAKQPAVVRQLQQAPGERVSGSALYSTPGVR